MRSFVMKSCQITLNQACLCVVFALKQIITVGAVCRKLGSFKGATFLERKTKQCIAPVIPSSPPGRPLGWIQACLHSTVRLRAALVLLRVPGTAVLVTSTASGDTWHLQWLQPALHWCKSSGNLQGNQSRLARAQHTEAGTRKKLKTLSWEVYAILRRAH